MKYEKHISELKELINIFPQSSEEFENLKHMHEVSDKLIIAIGMIFKIEQGIEELMGEKTNKKKAT